MDFNQHIWQAWADVLQRRGVRELVASFLEAVGPLSLLAAQMVYLGQPLLNRSLPEGHLTALAQMLEDDSETRAFVTFLREGSLE